MDQRAKRKLFESVEQLCRDQGMPLTVQRRAILDTVLDMDDHPTADRIHKAVAGRMSGISRATVYRTLETLVRLGAIAKAGHLGSAARYDSRVDTHHHLVCQFCDRVIDISDDQLDALPVPDTSAFGFEVLDFTVQLRGICRHCRAEEES